MKNTWIDNVAYKGVNTIVEKNGLKFELQYHTHESFNLKNGKLHEIYEKQRFPDVSDEQKRKLEREMISLSAQLQIPKKIESIQ